jgi:hypothetical protein
MMKDYGTVNLFNSTGNKTAKYYLYDSPDFMIDSAITITQTQDHYTTVPKGTIAINVPFVLPGLTSEEAESHIRKRISEYLIETYPDNFKRIEGLACFTERT